MSVLTIPNTFVASTSIIASQMNANFTAITSVVNGALDQTNFGSLSGVLTWSISSNVLAQSVTSSSTAGVFSATATGVLAAGKSIYGFVSGANQTTGDAGASFQFTSASSTIPVQLIQNAGTGHGLSVLQTGVLAANKAGISSAISGAQTTGIAAIYGSVAATGTIPAVRGASAGTGAALKGENTSTGNSLELGDGTTVLYAIDATGSIVKASEPPGGNLAPNGGLDYWVSPNAASFTANLLSAGALGGMGYGAIGFYAKNTGNTGGGLAISKVAAGVSGSGFGMKAIFAGAAASTGTCDIIYVLENKASLALFNKTASASFQVKAFGNVTQVGVQFLYATTEIRPTITVGAETLTSINAAGFTQCKVENIALGTAMTTAGVIGVRVRVTAVSSGNIYDTGNGIVIEQLMLNLGQRVGTWARAWTQGIEDQAVRRLYQYVGCGANGRAVTNSAAAGGINFPVMRAAPSTAAPGTMPGSGNPGASVSGAQIGIGNFSIPTNLFTVTVTTPTGAVWSASMGAILTAGTQIVIQEDAVVLDAMIY
jgi:hypothetical protein